MLLIGYLSQLSVRAGEPVDVSLSTPAASVDIDLVRLIHGDENPLGPGFIHQEIAEVAPIKVSGGEQHTPIGSYGCSLEPVTLPHGGLAVSFTIWPTTPTLRERQGLLSLVGSGEGFRVILNADGRLGVCDAAGRLLVISSPLRARAWYAVGVTVTPTDTTLTVDEVTHAGARRRRVEELHGPTIVLPASAALLIAAAEVTELHGRPTPIDLYNGKIERLRIDGLPADGSTGATVAEWDFSRDMSAQVIPASAGGPDLVLVNTPTRAMTGSNWTDRVHAWEQDPTQYGAIHFHDDDLADAGWPVAATLTIPESLPSGVYAVRLRAEGAADDYIPLAVRPAASATPARIAFMLGTFTYVAYANEHLTEGDFEQASEIPVETGSWEDLLVTHPEWGKSVYDLHTDGSGVAYSSFLRPIPSLRPTYRFWGFHAPRRFPADLYVVNFLTQLGEPFDILTEHDLNQEPQTALADYQTVLTGSHPEYYSGEMLDALEHHVDGGGGLLYLGGDGFYWVTTQFADLPHVIEVRKSEGLRHWDADPGERYHASTGELGGLWRTRGRSPNKLFGVGMAANGWDNNAPGYRRSERSYQEDAAWVFDGIADAVVGDFGLIMNGTSGDEIDRIDYRWGTPEHTIVLASSEPHSEWYVPVPEDVTTVSNQLNGTFNPEVRSDMVLVENASGGAVFSVGSIVFTGALPVNGGSNNVAQLLANVVRNFTARNAS